MYDYEEETSEKDPREIRLVRVGDLVVDPHIQRKIRTSRGPKIKRITETFDWGKLGIIEVRQLKNGSLRVSKGQGRTLAMQMRDPETLTYVLVVPYVNDAEEALAALAEEDSRAKSSVTAADKWMYAVRGNSMRHLWAIDALSKIGITVNTDHPRSLTNITAVTQLTNILYGTNLVESNWFASKELFARVIDTLRLAYPVDNEANALRFDATLLEAMAAVYRRAPKLDQNRLITRIKAEFPVPKALIQMGKSAPRHVKGGVTTVVRDAIIDAYNYKLSVNRI